MYESCATKSAKPGAAPNALEFASARTSVLSNWQEIRSKDLRRRLAISGLARVWCVCRILPVACPIDDWRCKGVHALCSRAITASNIQGPFGCWHSVLAEDFSLPAAAEFQTQTEFQTDRIPDTLQMLDSTDFSVLSVVQENERRRATEGTESTEVGIPVVQQILVRLFAILDQRNFFRCMAFRQRSHAPRSTRRARSGKQTEFQTRRIPDTLPCNGSRPGRKRIANRR